MFNVILHDYVRVILTQLFDLFLNLSLIKLYVIGLLEIICHLSSEIYRSNKLIFLNYRLGNAFK